MIMQGRSLFVDQIRMSQIQEKKNSKKNVADETPQTNENRDKVA